MAADDKNWAKEYILDPLSGPDPSDETGPGSHFRSTFAPITPSPPPEASKSSPPKPAQHTGGSSSTNPFRRSTGSNASSRGYPTPPTSASPRREKFPGSHREQAFSSHATDKNLSPERSSPGSQSGHRRRASSLTERYPGDTSVNPLDMIRKDSTRAHRAPHLRKANHHGTDAIDRLDPTGTYHHESPYDAASVARNRQTKYSPIAALRTSNAEVLKATPPEQIQDSLKRHRPLDGVAAVPPGMRDGFGRRYSYEEGTDLMREGGGNYKRWPGETYLPDDLKGKGEPSYSIEKALKEHKARGGDDTFEMQPQRSRNKSMGHRDRPSDMHDGESSALGLGRSNTTGRKVGLKQRLLRRKV